MSNFIRFKAEFGWSELISLIAAAVALVALYHGYQANSPSISISNMPARAHHVCNEFSKEWNVIAIMPFRITNNGGRTTTLIGIGRNSSLLPFVASSEDNEILEIWHKLLIPNVDAHQKGIDAPSWDLKKIFDDSKALYLDVDRASYTNPSVFEISIPPGESKIVNLGFRSITSTSDNNRVTRYEVNLNAAFSHGQSVPMQIIVDRPFVGRYLPECR